MPRPTLVISARILLAGFLLATAQLAPTPPPSPAAPSTSTAPPATTDSSTGQDRRDESVTSMEDEVVVEYKPGKNGERVAGDVTITQHGADGSTRKAPPDQTCTSDPYIENDLVSPVMDSVGFDFAEIQRLRTIQRRRVITEKSLGNSVETSRLYSPTGEWVSLVCENADGETVFNDIAPVGGPPVTLGQLITQALLELDPPIHEFVLNPNGKQLVQFPTLFWIDPEYWDAERTTTKTNGNVTLTLTLAPFESEWDPGDGSDPVVCDGPGEVWKTGDKGETFYCKHTYQTVKGQPFTVTSTVRFRLDTETNSNEVLGPFPPLERVGTAEAGVREIQVVETND